MNAFVAEFASGVVRGVGKDRVDLLHRLSTNDLRGLAPGGYAPTAFTDEKGRVLDWVGLYAREGELLVRTSPGRAASLVEWLNRYTIMEDFAATDVSDTWGGVVVYGSDAAAALGFVSVPAREHYIEHGGTFITRGLAAYGERVELLVPRADVAGVIEAAEQRGAKRASAEDLEWQRLLAGVPSPAHEFVSPTNPLELRINAGVISWTKGCYIGQEVLARLDSYDKLARITMGVQATQSLALGEEARLYRDEHNIGRITSWMTRAGATIGLALVSTKAASEGPAELRTATARVAVELVQRPFFLGAA